MSIVLLQLMGLNPLVATLLVDMDFVVVRTDGDFCRNTKQSSRVHRMANELDQFLSNDKLDV